MKHNSDFRYDLKVGNEGENLLAQLLQGQRIEVKTDFGWHRTGNFYIEYESRGKPSGIATSEAEWYALIGIAKGITQRHVHQNGLALQSVSAVFLLPKKRLKELCRRGDVRKNVRGGDKNTSVGFLIPSVLLSTYHL